MYKNKIRHIFKRQKHDVVTRELVNIPASFEVIESKTDIDQNVYTMSPSQHITSKYLTMVTVMLCSISVCMCLIYLPSLIETYYKHKIKYTKWALLLNLVSPSASPSSVIPSSLGMLMGLYNWFCWII